MVSPDDLAGIGDGRAAGAIVFVHGIGEQTPGSTLARFGQPLTTYAAASGGPGSTLERTPDEWRLTLDDGRSRRRWLLTEVHWADVVAPPSYRQLLRWMVLVVPWILHSDALLWSHRRPRKPRTRHWWARIYYLYLWSAKMLWAFARGMLLLIGGLVAQLVLTMVGAVGLVPVLRGPARWAQSLLIGSVGDSYAYLLDEATWQRIQQRLSDVLERMSSRADRIVVVTHSQGTAVMHRAVSAGRVPQQLTTWVSLGSGLQKLLALHTTKTRALVVWASFRLLTVGLFLASMPFWAMEYDPDTGEEVITDFTAAALMLGVLALVGPLWTVRRLRSRMVDDIRYPLLRRQLRWLDLYSFHDPVPGGPIPGTTGDEAERPVASVEVYNEGSFLRDHSAYVDNVEDVVRRIHDLMAPSTALDPWLARLLAERRARRVRLRRPLWALAAGTACAFTAPAVRSAPWLALDLAALAIAGALSGLLFDRVWRGWNRKATARILIDPWSRTPARAMASTLAGVSFLALVVVTTVGMGTELSTDPVLQFVLSWGTTLTLIAGPLTVLLVISLDYRAFEATQRSLDGPAGEPPPPRRSRSRRVTPAAP
jgi:hypothetical protein